MTNIASKKKISIASKALFFGKGFLSAFDISGGGILNSSFLTDQNKLLTPIDMSKIISEFKNVKLGIESDKKETSN